MPKKQPKYKATPWQPDPAKWNAHLSHPIPVPQDPESPKPKGIEPKGGWQLWRLDDLSDAKQE